MSTEDPIAQLKKLREPFLPNQISKLPKGNITLDYVGHAALTDRLLDVDPLWSWEPLALTPEGLPLLDSDGGLWIKLTVCGITRLGYGDAAAKSGPNAMKERIGDALRNAGMRFGIALDLWHKGELHDNANAAKPPATRTVVRNGQRVDTTTGEIHDDEAVKAAAAKEAAERAEAEKAEKKRRLDELNQELSSRFKKLGYDGDPQYLAKALCKKDKPVVVDIKNAMMLTDEAWIHALTEGGIMRLEDMPKPKPEEEAPPLELSGDDDPFADKPPVSADASAQTLAAIAGR